MVIVFVTDMYCHAKNGTAMTCRRFAEGLREKGHEVRILSIGEKSDDNYYVDEWQIPFVTWLAHTEGFGFARFDMKTAARALKGADVVHFTLPTPFNIRIMHLAHKMGIPCTAAFHMQPENFTYIVHVNKIKKSSDIVYEAMRRVFYKNFLHVHCPSYFIANEMKNHGYKGHLHVISNGVGEQFSPGEPTKQDEGFFDILMVGRLSPEKMQTLLIDAVKMSKYEDRIRIFYAGDGNLKNRILNRGRLLSNPPSVKFYTQPELIEQIRNTDLYVHTSSVEIESIACLEAVSCGVVPLINNSRKSAAVQFALDERSLFDEDSAASLAEKLDYWIEHPEERAAMKEKYSELGKKYALSESISRIEGMFERAVSDFHAGKDKFSRGR